MHIMVLCNTTNPFRLIPREVIVNLLNKNDFLVFLGGVAPRNNSTRIYSVTGLFDDHYVARILDNTTVFIESKTQYLFNKWYIVGIGGRDPLANIQAIEKSLREMRHASNDMNILVVSYFCPYGLCDKSILGGRRGLKELREFIETYPVRVILSCDCGPGIVEYKGITTMCLGRGDCIGFLDISKDNRITGRVYCGDKGWSTP